MLTIYVYGFSAILKELSLCPYFNQVHFELNLPKLPINLKKCKIKYR